MPIEQDDTKSLNVVEGARGWWFIPGVDFGR
jgi:hypothetical protein